MRRTRPDGNCFFRGFTFAYFEFLLTNEAELDKFIDLIDKCKDMLVKSGFLFFTIEDFHDTVSNELNQPRTPCAHHHLLSSAHPNSSLTF